MSPTLIILLIVFVVVLVFVIFGWRRGLIRMFLSSFSVVIVIILTSLLQAPVAQWLREKTPVGETVESAVEDIVDLRIEKAIEDNAKGSISLPEGYEKYMSGSKAPDEYPDDDLILNGDIQEDVITSLALPRALISSLSEAESTVKEYADQTVLSFKTYLTDRLTAIIIKALTYVLLFTVLNIIARILLRLTGVINRIPVVGTFNRFLGALVGIFEALLIIWVACILLMVFAGNTTGNVIVAAVHENNFLSLIYDSNPLLGAARNIFPKI